MTGGPNGCELCGRPLGDHAGEATVCPEYVFPIRRLTAETTAESLERVTTERNSAMLQSLFYMYFGYVELGHYFKNEALRVQTQIRGPEAELVAGEVADG